MKKALILTTIMTITFSTMSFAGNTLKTTVLKVNAEPTKKEVLAAKKTLEKALKTKSPKSYKYLLEKARKTIAAKKGYKTIKAAIVAEKNDESVNLANFEDFLESADGLCYNGDINTALMVANKLNDIEYINIYDEYSLDSIEINGKSIDFKVMDEFSFGDQDASEEDREDFITTYSASKC